MRTSGLASRSLPRRSAAAAPPRASNRAPARPTRLHNAGVSLQLTHPRRACCHRESTEALSNLSIAQGQEELAASAQPAAQPGAGALMAVNGAQVRGVAAMAVGLVW